MSGVCVCVCVYVLTRVCVCVCVGKHIKNQDFTRKKKRRVVEEAMRSFLKVNWFDSPHNHLLFREPLGIL